MAESPSKGDRTRQAIIEAATHLFVEQGFHGTSMRQIAQRARIALGGIYNHFQSKEEIFDVVLLEKHPYHQVLVILQSTPGDTIEELAHNAAQAMVSELQNRPDFFNLVFIEISEFKGRHAPLLFQTIFPQFLPLFQRFIGEPGQMRNIPLQTILFSFLGILLSYVLSQAVVNKGISLSAGTNDLEQYLNIFLHGIVQGEAE